MNFLDLFSGIGGFRLGMEQNGHTCVGHCEIDKYADKSYRAMHNVKENEWYASDITKVTDELIRVELGHRNINIICGGFPCQSFSIAGKRRGFEDTRGTLFFDVCRFAKILRPEYLFLENVRGLLSHDNGNTFEAILCALADIGYDAEWEVLNTKRWLPQNRERIFIIGHLRGSSTRKVFPLPGSGEAIDEKSKHIPQQIASTLCSVDYKISRGMNLINEINIIGTTKTSDAVGTNSRQWVHGIDGIVGALGAGDYKQPKQIAIPILTPSIKHAVMVKEATKQGYAIAEEGDSINLAVPNSETRRGRVGKGIANTLDTSCNQGVVVPSIIEDFYKSRNAREYTNVAPTLRSDRQGLIVKEEMRIRKLTPLECFRLQGFPDELFYKAQSVNSDSQLYKQAGNSVSVPVIKAIAKQFEKGVII
jgi:DNA (cytosine-5)-methyltransferase 1